jgi:S-DNA-T family DNA segregation ATPase FtsK/SpoIIIE
LPYSYGPASLKKSSEAFCGIGHSDNFILDLEKDQHIIVAGESDSGKSSFITSIVLSYILSNKNIELYLHDFQNITLGIFENCRKVKSYTTAPNQFDFLLDKMEEECEKRLKLFRSVEKKVYIEKLESWNEEFPNKNLPYIFVVVDEFATLADKEYDEIMSKFRKRVAMDRKAGIHYLIAIQRPSADIIAGAIKANMSTRISFKVVSNVDSEVILGGLHGAEKIKNQGRFLAKYRGQFKEYQALYIKPKEIRKLLKENNAFKTKEDIELEKQQERKRKIELFHKNNLNPYRKDINKEVY